ncbi:NADH-ubiquinone oxidoreductase [Zancudomyces culisetae]|uniref:NADH-ubiquinone oxidoreductase n=1 Tax=Zancudomyces culisetae TaxID=1213189 RepID=A0A1R1PS85_ZANCU|nr:NADH-ubiquinone oxidoreductase [Zancudomyces culisetae]|eukprot:OMH83753.1 NADH-ubiquinone oxidoreductase [Zancudomyces culisetae]
MASTRRNSYMPATEWVDPTPLPADDPHIDPNTPELGLTSAPLKSVAFFLGAVCKDKTDDFMLCKQDNNDPKACLSQGKQVTDCGIEVVNKVKQHCADSFANHWKCLDLNNQEYKSCRPQERTFNECIFTSLGWQKTIPGAPKDKQGEVQQIWNKKNQIFS